MTDKKELFEKEEKDNGTIGVTVMDEAPAAPASDASADKAINK